MLFTTSVIFCVLTLRRMGVSRTGLSSTAGRLLEELCRQKKALILFASLTLGIIAYSQSLQFQIIYRPYHLSPGNQSYEPTYLVNTPGCRIQDMDPFDSPTMVDKYFKFNNSIPTCPIPFVKLVNGSHLIINEDNGRNKSDKVTCCWREITRKTETLENYTKDADWGVEYNSTCTPIPNGTEGVIVSATQYLKVECVNSTGFNVWYDFFSLVPSPKIHSASTANKTNYWAKEIRNNVTLPPNIMIIGIDAISRLHMIRSLPRTKAFLHSNGFLEMRGYTKTGENTFPISMAAFGGMRENDTRTKCWTNKNTAMDFCPFIWNNFSTHNYVTAFVEDSPGLGMFNYDKTGFVKPPTDYFIRPLMVAEHLTAKRDRTGGSDGCLGGGLTNTKVIMRYTKDFVKQMDGVNPFFLLSWFTNVAHDDKNGLPPYDQEFRSFLENLLSSVGENTVLFFISDHGYRFGSFRETFLGFYEESLPFFFVRVPPFLAQTHPSWMQALQTNSARLTTPYDLYATLVQLLGVVSPTFTSPSPLYGTSLFQIASLQRNCEDSSIPEKYCMCGISNTDFQNSALTLEIGNLIVATINAELVSANLSETICSRLNYSSFLYGREVGVGEVWNGQGKLEPYRDVLVAVETMPWEGRFEGRIRLFTGSGTSDDPSCKKQVLGSVGRINAYAGKSDCITNPKMKHYCVCPALWMEEFKRRNKMG